MHACQLTILCTILKIYRTTKKSENYLKQKKLNICNVFMSKVNFQIHFPVTSVLATLDSYHLRTRFTAGISTVVNVACVTRRPLATAPASAPVPAPVQAPVSM